MTLPATLVLSDQMLQIRTELANTYDSLDLKALHAV